MTDPIDQHLAGWRRMPSWLLSQTAAHGSRLVAEGFAAAGARGYHYRLLSTLADYGSASQAQLGRRSGIHLSDMVAAINELSDRGLVQRTPDPTDRRRNVISLTAAGREHLGRLQAHLAQTQSALLAPLSPAEQDQLTGLLAKLLDYHDRRSGAQDGEGRAEAD